MLTDPRSAGPRPPFPKQKQPPPGETPALEPKPDHGEQSYRGTGLFTGTESAANEGAGTMYFPKASIELGGTGDMYIDSVIANKIVVYGTGRKTVTQGWDGNEGARKVFLVE